MWRVPIARAETAELQTTWDQMEPSRKEQIDYDLVVKAGLINCSVEECAALCGVTPRVIEQWLAEDTQFREAWEKGRGVGAAWLRRLMYRSADSVSAAGVQMQIQLSRQRLGMSHKVREKVPRTISPLKPSDFLVCPGTPCDWKRLPPEEISELHQAVMRIEASAIARVAKRDRDRVAELTRKAIIAAPREGGASGKAIDYDVVLKAALIDCPLEECAILCGLPAKSAKERMTTDLEFRQAWNRGNQLGRATLRRLMYRSANSVSRAAVQIQSHLSTHWLATDDHPTASAKQGSTLAEALVGYGARIDSSRLAEDERVELGVLFDLIEQIGFVMLSEDQRERAVELALKASSAEMLRAAGERLDEPG